VVTQAYSSMPLSSDTILGIAVDRIVMSRAASRKSIRTAVNVVRLSLSDIATPDASSFKIFILFSDPYLVSDYRRPYQAADGKRRLIPL